MVPTRKNRVAQRHTCGSGSCSWNSASCEHFSCAAHRLQAVVFLRILLGDENARTFAHLSAPLDFSAVIGLVTLHACTRTPLLCEQCDTSWLERHSMTLAAQVLEISQFLHSACQASPTTIDHFRWTRVRKSSLSLCAPHLQGARKRSRVRVVRQNACSIAGVDDDDQ